MADFDEMQVARRNQAAMTTMVILAVLVFANGAVVDAYGMWGTGMDQASGIVAMPLTYFSVRNVAAGSYFGRGQAWGWTAGAFGVLLVLYAGLFGPEVARGATVWRDGQAGSLWSPALLFGFFAATFVSVLIRQWAERDPQRGTT